MIRRRRSRLIRGNYHVLCLTLITVLLVASIELPAAAGEVDGGQEQLTGAGEVTPPTPSIPAAPIQIPKAPPPLPFVGWANIFGQVTDENRQPVAGAVLTVQPGGLTAITASDGSYGLRDIPVVGTDYALMDISVTKLGFGAWSVLQTPIYSGGNHTMYPMLTLFPQTTTNGAPMSDQALEGHTSASPGPGKTPRWGDDWRPPPTIRVEFVDRFESGLKQCNATTHPPTHKGGATYSLRYYLEHVVLGEINARYPVEAIRVQAMAALNYAWFWVHKGGKPFTPAYYDVDDSTNYQCFRHEGAIDSRISDAVSWALARVMHRNGVFQSEYRATSGSTCDSPNDNRMYQVGARSWASGSCAGGARDANWILHHYYDSGGAFSIDGVQVPGTPTFDSTRPRNTHVGLYFASYAATHYQIQRWNGSAWQVLYDKDIGDHGELLNDWTDTSAGSGTGYWYIVWGANAAGWSSGTQIWVPSWTTRIWNASFERGGAFWTQSDGFSNPTSCPGAGDWDQSCYGYHGTETGHWSEGTTRWVWVNSGDRMCPEALVAHLQSDLLNVRMEVRADTGEVWYSDHNFLTGNTWWRIYWTSCPQFGSLVSGLHTFTLRLISTNGGWLGVDKARLVFNSYGNPN